MFSCPAQAAHYYAKLVKRPVGEMSCNDNDGLVHCEPRNKAGEAAAAVRGCHQSSVRPPDHNCKGSGMGARQTLLCCFMILAILEVIGGACCPLMRQTPGTG